MSGRTKNAAQVKKTPSETRSANELDLHLGRRVRLRRLEMGMSQERLAEILGVTFQQVQKYEKGVNRIASSRLFDIGQALDTDLTEFFAGFSHTPRSKGRERDEGSILNAFTDADTIKLAMLFATIKESAVRKRIIALVTALVAESAAVDK